jgi:hypothetical protein
VTGENGRGRERREGGQGGRRDATLERVPRGWQGGQQREREREREIQNLRNPNSGRSSPFTRDPKPETRNPKPRRRPISELKEEFPNVDFSHIRDDDDVLAERIQVSPRNPKP